MRYLATGRSGYPCRAARRRPGLDPLRRPVPLQLDGEDLSDITEVVFEAERDAVSVLISGFVDINRDM